MKHRCWVPIGWALYMYMPVLSLGNNNEMQYLVDIHVELAFIKR